MAEPNLFTHACGELSQDAVLCSLIEWTGASCPHAVARDFIAMLYRLHDHAPPECTSIRVMKQVDHADVVALVDEADLLVIEDKTDTTQHGNQLSRYRQALAQRHPGRRFIGIYLKTGDESSYAHARSDDWRVCTRKQLLAVLPRGARNVILRDFQAHLEKIDEAVESYATSTLDTKWSGRAWTGAFIALQARLPGAGWSYVANPSGGFMGLWMPERQLGDHRAADELRSLALGRRVEPAELLRTRASEFEDWQLEALDLGGLSSR